MFAKESACYAPHPTGKTLLFLVNVFIVYHIICVTFSVASIRHSMNCVSMCPHFHTKNVSAKLTRCVWPSLTFRYCARFVNCNIWIFASNIVFPLLMRNRLGLQVLNADCDPLTYVEKCLRGEINAEHAHWNTSDLTARLSWINWENLGVHPSRRTLLTSLALSGDPTMNPNHKYVL